jgi:hypothetical protein
MFAAKEQKMFDGGEDMLLVLTALIVPLVTLSSMLGV